MRNNIKSVTKTNICVCVLLTCSACNKLAVLKWYVSNMSHSVSFGWNAYVKFKGPKVL